MIVLQVYNYIYIYMNDVMNNEWDEELNWRDGYGKCGKVWCGKCEV